MRFWLMATCLIIPVTVGSQVTNPGVGIPLDIADARAARISNLRYSLQLTIPEAASTALEGNTSIRFDLATTADPLVIDFATSREHVRRVNANGQESAFTWRNGHIVVPAVALTQGANQIDVWFKAGDASLNRNADFLYALFVPARAHLESAS